ncbi:hypothetical protein GGQ88_000239 [Novosphingobium hassiacum]|uniref:Uncharacterized protein n=1 Tax=Novosphingobium hassiacum TaxID=173676 RepID=A0A7W5ZTL2_9SPHN|nr:hypothetical protein [Novosphingobium hassiacum]MBB3858999.1 hypothetical protein [Novosphingobium hassiacum]
MSDIQTKVAARRAELAQEEKIRSEKQAALAREQKIIDQEERLKVAGESTTDGLSPVEIEAILHKQAKSLWSTQDNVLVFGLVIGGLILLPVGGLGAIPIAIGLFMANSLGKRYRQTLRDRYPDKFGRADT